MRVTDNRYAGEIDKFNLAMRMIRHEARNGTIRALTGFTEDRVRKLVVNYCRQSGGPQPRRRRGKSPRRIGRFISSSARQADATALASLFVYCRVATLDDCGGFLRIADTSRVQLGQRLCQAFETYRSVLGGPRLSFEWAWSLYCAMVESSEIYFARCASCSAPYVQDRYALDYRRCPACERHDAGASNNHS